MSRTDRSKKRNKADWHFLRLTAYWTATFVITEMAHFAGDAVRGCHGYGGEMLLPMLAVFFYYAHRQKEAQE